MKWIKKLFEPKEDIPKLYWGIDVCPIEREEFTEHERIIIKKIISHQKWKDFYGKDKYRLDCFEKWFPSFVFNINETNIYNNNYLTRIILYKASDYYYYANHNQKNYKIDSMEGVKQFLNDKLK